MDSNFGTGDLSHVLEILHLCDTYTCSRTCLRVWPECVVFRISFSSFHSFLNIYTWWPLRSVESVLQEVHGRN